MPEDVIARAIAEQASRSPQELGTIAPGVVVGFGDLGLSALIRLRDLLTASPSCQEVLPLVRLVLVAPAGTPVPEGSGIDHIAVSPGWAPDRIRLRHIDEWLSPDLARSQPEDRSIRQVDRLAFFSHYQEIRTRLQAARDRALARGGDSACTIFLVAGLGDETGSGMVLDAAHLAGQILEEIPGGQVVGYLALPGASGRDESLLSRPGAFAALKELDFLNAGGELPVRYAAGAPSQALRRPLFAACYLFDAPRPGTSRPGDPATADVIALHIHADFVAGGLACTNRAVRERHSRYASPGREDRAGCQTAYRAVGASRLFVDAGRLNRGYRLALASRLLDRVLAPSLDDLAARIARLATPWSPGDLSGGLVKRLATTDGHALKDDVAAWTGELAERLGTKALPRDVADWLEARIAELGARLEALGDTIAANLAGAVRSFEAELDAELAAIGSEAAGSNWFDPAERFLQGAARRLESLHAQAAGQRAREAEIVAGCEDLVRDAVSEAGKAFAHPLARFGASRRMVTERSLAALWRVLEEFLVSRLRLALQDAVPSFFGQAAEAIGRRAAAIGTVRGRVADLADRVGQALQQVCREPVRPGEVFDPAWIRLDVAAVLDGDRGADVLGAMGARLLDHLGAASPLDLAAMQGEPDFDVRLAAAVRASGDDGARGMPQRNLADRLLQLQGTEAAQREALRQAIEAAVPRLALEAREGADLPAGEACSLLVGIPGGPANPHGAFATLLDLLLLCLDDLSLQVPVSIADLPGRGEQLVFLRECAGFPLRSLAAIDDLAARYREFARLSKADPVHIAKDPGAFETIPGIFPPDAKTKQRALEAFAVGVQWGAFEVENGIVVHRQKLPGMTFLDTRIIGTLDRPLRAVKYLVDHPDLVQYAQGRIAAVVEELRHDPAKRQDRLARLERYYLRLLEQCRQIVTGPAAGVGEGEDVGGGPVGDEVIKKLPLWDLAETILEFNARHGLEPVVSAGKAAEDRPFPVGLESGAAAEPGLEPGIAEPAPSPELTALPVPPPAAATQDAAGRLQQGSPGEPGSAGVPPVPTVAAAQVQCPECQSIWPATAKFCAECAAPLQRAGTCPECAAPTPPGGKFCPECAAPLLGQSPVRIR